jgi:DNA polymerase III subunit beta
MQINIPVRHLLAARLFTADDKDVRYYLRGVLVEASPERLRIVASNGHAAYLGQPEVGQDNPLTESMSVIVPNDALAMLAKHVNRNLSVCTLETGDSPRLGYAGTWIGFTPIDGKFPDVDRVIPKDYSGEAANFNTDYLIACWKAMKILLDRKDCYAPLIRHNGDRAGLVNLDHDAFAVVMPMRAEQPELPEWFAAKAEADQPERAAA